MDFCQGWLSCWRCRCIDPASGNMPRSKDRSQTGKSNDQQHIDQVNILLQVRTLLKMLLPPMAYKNTCLLPW